jgi:3-oxoacyl-[acyl-carrier protein] reductase
MSFNLSAHVALVTGSTAGLGKASALALAKAGAKVCINYHQDHTRAERVFKEIQEVGVESVLICADVTQKDDVARLYRTVADTLGNIDIVVASAAPDYLPQPFESYNWEDYEQMIAHFLKSPFLLTQSALQHMKMQRWGRIVCIVSDVFHRSTAPFSAYAAAKGAQIGWSRSIAPEFAPWGITVNMVAPGWIPVERHQRESQHVKDDYLAAIPAARWGLPQDVAHAVLYFASEEASFVTGQTVCVNGGLCPW